MYYYNCSNINNNDDGMCWNWDRAYISWAQAGKQGLSVLRL